MKRSFLLWVAVVVVTVMAGTIALAQSQNQSLGDVARAVKKTKNPSAAAGTPKVYDNDNLPRSTSISVVGDTSAPDADKKADKKKDETQGEDQDKANDQDQDKTKHPDGTAKEDDKAADKKPELKEGQSAEERQKALQAWKDKLAGEKDKVSLLSRELDVLQRERQMKYAEFYTDGARRARDPNGFANEDAKYKQDIAEKQKQLDDAKHKFDDMQDDARKSGAPNSVTE
jgi:hypothetical protein